MQTTWDDLVGTALLGTERRRPPGVVGDAEEAAAGCWTPPRAACCADGPG